MRFLVHGLLIKMVDGTPVVITPHLLRHAFAAHAVQVEQIEVDLVGGMLQQKNLEVTRYYSRRPLSMVAASIDDFLCSIATHVAVDEVIRRTPIELQRLFEEASGKAGTLADVAGGLCTNHGFCPAKFACIGCIHKVPDPNLRHQVEQQKIWANAQIELATEEGLLAEAERMRQLVREAEVELREMDQMEAYRADERWQPVLLYDGGVKTVVHKAPAGPASAGHDSD